MQQMSPMLHAQIAKQQEINNSNQNNNVQQIDLTQKPDIVSFSGKKVARNTGIGTIIGSVIGGIKQRFSAKEKYVDGNAVYDNLINAEENKIYNSYLDYLKATLQKVKDGAELTAEEKDFLKGLNFEPSMKYLPKENFDKVVDSFIKDCSSSYTRSSSKHLSSGFDVTLSEMSFGYFFNGKEKCLEHLSGKSDHSDFINSCSKLKEILEDGIRRCKETGDAHNIETIHKFPQLFWAEYVGPSYGRDIYRDLQPNDYFESSYLNFSKDKIAQASESIKLQLINKETLKGAGISAGIVGGVALVGSLIYKAIKNKNVEQNK